MHTSLWNKIASFFIVYSTCSLSYYLLSCFISIFRMYMPCFHQCFLWSILGYCISNINPATLFNGIGTFKFIILFVAKFYTVRCRQYMWWADNTSPTIQSRRFILKQIRRQHYIDKVISLQQAYFIWFII